MSDKVFFFAGGGTGGHIYPALAVAERLIELEPAATIRFFCSSRPIDSQILEKSSLPYTALPIAGLSLRPGRILDSCRSFIQSYRTARADLAESRNAIVVGAGGFASGPVCLAAHRLKSPVVLLNVDLLPGRANKIIARWADHLFLQFEDTTRLLPRTRAKVTVAGCPLRQGFHSLDAAAAIKDLGLDERKKLLLVTGASSGAASINEAVCSLLGKLEAFSGDWQIVHLAGSAHVEQVRASYAAVRIAHRVLPYWDDMASLLAATDLLVGRSGAVSVAEYAAACVPSICMPYPHHRDRHQYLNAGKLVEAGAAVIVDDLPDPLDRAEWLWEELEDLMTDHHKREQMAEACLEIATPDAARKIAETLLEMASRN